MDAAGSGEFNELPPPHLPSEYTAAWRWLVERLPRVALSASDELAVEMAARLLAVYWTTGDLHTVKELRAWIVQLGMTPA